MESGLKNFVLPIHKQYDRFFIGGGCKRLTSLHTSCSRKTAPVTSCCNAPMSVIPSLLKTLRMCDMRLLPNMIRTAWTSTSQTTANLSVTAQIKKKIITLALVPSFGIQKIVGIHSIVFIATISLDAAG